MNPLALLVIITYLFFPVFSDKPRVESLRIGVTRRIPEEDCMRRANVDDNLGIHYTGLLYQTGVKFDSSRDRGQTLDFKLGAGQLIKGMDQGIRGMCVGETRRITIPAHLGYGKEGSPPVIPEDADLIFEVELVSINDQKNEL
ncbi:unnamed protein product [Protopolystoma xenopodis]|uniref:peptidylprolyl isomerase n=1 Tax=Protopolystoma xenopodis TaxID=117903 RepID=A0A3S5ABE2_9PLAT|nr:unnamed protein product [Protopolystoma xenopodis]